MTALRGHNSLLPSSATWNTKSQPENWSVRTAVPVMMSKADGSEISPVLTSTQHRLARLVRYRDQDRVGAASARRESRHQDERRGRNISNH